MWVHSMVMNTYVKFEDPESLIFIHLAKNVHMNYMGDDRDGDIAPDICEIQRCKDILERKKCIRF